MVEVLVMSILVSEEERNNLSKFRLLLEESDDFTDPESLEFCDDSTLVRFLRARQGNVESAHAMIRATLKWREENETSKIVCSACKTDPKSHSTRIIGWCMKGRPVFYSSFASQTSRDPEDNIDHIIALLESTFKMISAQSFVWVIDFAGFQTGDITPSTGRQALKLFCDNYPERLGAAYLLDSPLVFSGLWRVLKQWIEPTTERKISFVRLRDRNMKLKNVFDSNLLNRLDEEIKRIRNTDSQIDLHEWWNELPPVPPRGPNRSIVNA
uniref:CRAL-TRIO domain-containing protein n=1 Tax=Timspurckia oligopyrenoides TaxID=708627 RepID=A0A7S0ZGV5_9RHOD